jgi:hypothetical protein
MTSMTNWSWGRAHHPRVLNVDEGNIVASDPANRPSGLVASDAWNRIRIHVKMSSAGDVEDGEYHIWVNDEQIKASTGFITNAQTSPYPWIGTCYTIIAANMNQGPGEEQTLNWGRFMLFTSDPVW